MKQVRTVTDVEAATKEWAAGLPGGFAMSPGGWITVGGRRYVDWLAVYTANKSQVQDYASQNGWRWGAQ